MADVSSGSTHLLPRLLGRRGLTTANSGAGNGESQRYHSFSIEFMLRDMKIGLIRNSNGGDVKWLHILVGTPSGNGHLQGQLRNDSIYLNSSSENKVSMDFYLTGSGLCPVKRLHKNTAMYIGKR